MGIPIINREKESERVKGREREKERKAKTNRQRKRRIKRKIEISRAGAYENILRYRELERDVQQAKDDVHEANTVCRSGSQLQKLCVCVCVYEISLVLEVRKLSVLLGA